jgi:hypothetical protein
MYYVRNSRGSTQTMDILRYSISLDKSEKVSSLSSATSGGVALSGKDGKTIYFFGGYPNYAAVHKLDSITNVTVRLSMALLSSLSCAGNISINGTILVFYG